MSETVNLSEARTYGGATYGPGADVEIPDEMYEALDAIDYFDKEASEEDLFADLSDEQVANLEAAGFGDAESIAAATVEDLVEVEKVGNATAQKLKARAES